MKAKGVRGQERQKKWIAVCLCVWERDMSIPAADLQASQEELTLPDVQMAHWPESGGKDEKLEADQKEKPEEYTEFIMWALPFPNPRSFPSSWFTS